MQLFRKVQIPREIYFSSINFIKKKILFKDNYSFKNGKSKVNKNVDYYIAESLVDKVKIDGKEIINYKWLSAEKSIERLTFSKSKKILKRANKIINEYISDQ